MFQGALQDGLLHVKQFLVNQSFARAFQLFKIFWLMNRSNGIALLHKAAARDYVVRQIVVNRGTTLGDGRGDNLANLFLRKAACQFIDRKDSASRNRRVLKVFERAVFRNQFRVKGA